MIFPIITLVGSIVISLFLTLLEVPLLLVVSTFSITKCGLRTPVGLLSGIKSSDMAYTAVFWLLLLFTLPTGGWECSAVPLSDSSLILSCTETPSETNPPRVTPSNCLVWLKKKELDKMLEIIFINCPWLKPLPPETWSISKKLNYPISRYSDRNASKFIVRCIRSEYCLVDMPVKTLLYIKRFSKNEFAS